VNATIRVHVGIDDSSRRRFEAHHAHSFHGTGAYARQNLLEIVVTALEKQIEEVGLSRPRSYLGFLGTPLPFVASASLATVIPGYEPPTGSLSTTTALALCVFVAVPFFRQSRETRTG